MQSESHSIGWGEDSDPPPTPWAYAQSGGDVAGATVVTVVHRADCPSAPLASHYNQTVFDSDTVT